LAITLTLVCRLVEYKLNQSLRQSRNSYPDQGVDYRAARRVQLAAIPSGSNVPEATVNEHDNGGDTDYGTQDVNNCRNNLVQIQAAARRASTVVVIRNR